MIFLTVVGIFIFAIGFMLFVKNFVVGMFHLIGVAIYGVYDFCFVIPKHRKSKFFIEKTKQDIEKNENKLEKEESIRRKYVLGAMNFATNMRIQYPLADEALINRAVEELPHPSCSITPMEFEKEIKESHYFNLEQQKNNIKNTESKVYNLSDLDDREAIEVRKENPITMSLYKIENDYLLWVSNSSTLENSLFQSQNYSLMANYMMNVVETQQKLKDMKINVTSSQLEDIFKNNEQNFDEVFNRRKNLFG